MYYVISRCARSEVKFKGAHRELGSEGVSENFNQPSEKEISDFRVVVLSV